jgi:hypothetical protein
MILAPPIQASIVDLGPEERVQAAGADLAVLGYSVPSFVFWNGDSLKDLVVGEGGGTAPSGKVRVYLNTGTPSQPQFSAYFYAQSAGSDLACPASGCMGCFPRVVYWDGDGRKDLLIGQADGTVRVYLNTGTEEAPSFDGGAFVQVGEPGLKTNLDVGYRATPTAVDWNADGKKDLVVGALDGKVYIFLNEGTDAAPDFRVVQFAEDGGADLVVAAGRSSPHVMDLDADGKKDLLTGDTEGRLLFYANVGTDTAPSFSGYQFVESDSVDIDLAGTPRSRPFVCDWTGDGILDVLVGAGDGLVRLYQGLPDTGVDGDVPPADRARLLAARPNPFNPNTTIPLLLPEAQRVRVALYDGSGRFVALLADGDFARGRTEIRWNGDDAAGRPAPAGVYLARMDARDRSETVKLVLLR